jgi:hypothetical protein
MTLRVLSRLAAVTFLAPLLFAACSSSSSAGSSGCATGAQQACSCSNGGSGMETCGSDGVFGACSCSSGGPDASVDTGTGGGADSSTPSNDSSTETDTGDHCNGCGDGGGLGDSMPLDAADGTFGSMCTQDSDCTSDDCSDFPAKGGSFCTVPCTMASDCPAQAQGCNGMGQCKVP